MIVVGAALADDVDLATFRPAERSVVIGDANAELRYVFNADGNDGRLVAAAGDDVVGDVDAVEIENVLVAAGAGDRAAAIAKSPAIAAFERRGHGLEGEEFARVAAEGGQAHQLVFADDIADDRVGGLEFGLRLGRDFNDFFAGADFKRGVVGVGLGHIDFEVREGDGGKTSLGDFERIRAGGHVRERVFTRAHGCGGLCFIGGSVQEFDGGVRDYGAYLVDDRPQHGSGIRGLRFRREDRK